MPEIYRQSLVRRSCCFLLRLLIRPWPYYVAPAAGESCGAHICPIRCWLCQRMFTHTFMVLHRMSQHSQYQSTARIIVPSGSFSRAEQRLLFQLFFLFHFLSDRVGTVGIYSIFVTNQQQLLVWTPYNVLPLQAFQAV